MEVAGNLNRSTGLRQIGEKVMDNFKVKHVKTAVMLIGITNGELQSIHNAVM
jgi:hypothetical protein